MKLTNKAIDLLIVIGGRAFFALGGLLTVRIATEFMSPKQVGTITQLMATAGFFTLILFTPVWHYMARGFCEWKDNGVLIDNIRLASKYILISAGLVAVILYLIQYGFDMVIGIELWWVVLLVVLNFVFKSFYTIGANGYNILGNRKYFVLFSNVTIWVGLLLAILLFQFYNSVEYWVLGILSGYVVASVSAVALWYELKRSPVNINNSKDIMPFNKYVVYKFSWPVLIISCMWWMQSQSYRFIIPDLTVIGLFAMGYGVAAAPIALFEEIFSQFYEPIFYNELKSSDQSGQVKAWNNYAAYYIPSVIVMGIFIASSGHFLVQLLLGEEFREAGKVIVIWAAVTETVRASGSMLYQIGIAKVDQRLNLLPVSVGAILSVTGVYYFSRLIDPLIGTCIALLIAAITVYIIAYKRSTKYLPVTWPLSLMFKALLLSLTLPIYFIVSKSILKHEAIFSTIVVLSLGSLYMLLIQLYLYNNARELRPEKKLH